jgi:hypothetical protein
MSHLSTPMLREAIRKGFLQFCDSESDPRSFETWVCAAQELEGEIGHGPYLDLISADYGGRDVENVRVQCARLLEQHHPGSLARYRVRRILSSMLDDDSTVIPGLRRLVTLRHDSAELIPIEFVGFDSELDGVPTPDRYHLWEAAALAARLTTTGPYLKQVQQACRELLDDLAQRYPDDV